MEIPQRLVNGKLIQLYNEEFKRSVCEEYLRGTVSKLDVQRKYNIRYKSAIVTWMRTFGYVEQPLSYYKAGDMLDSMGKKDTNKDVAILERQIKALEKQLADTELKVVVYEKLIEVAERDLNIPIRKKPSTKRSMK